MKKVIIAGGRDFNDYNYLRDSVNVFLLSKLRGLEIVCGMANGADMLGAQWAVLHAVDVKEFPADWNTHGKAAGPIRNKEMAEYADTLIAFWDGKSKGTKNMIDNALKYGLETHVYMYE